MIEIDKVKIDPKILTRSEHFTLHTASIIRDGKVRKISFEVSNLE